MGKSGATPPIIGQKAYDQSSVFKPENLLREARRQKSTPAGTVPSVCVLDPDGDIVENLLAGNEARLNDYWACYHTKMYDFKLSGLELGIIGYTVGAPFAVLVAEASGQILPKKDPPFFVLVKKALRDEGTSYHYIPPSEFAFMDDKLLNLLDGKFSNLATPVYVGTTWTTDAPFRETEQAIIQARDLGILAVEMEAAALYAFSEARSHPVVCFAHVTNRMGSVEGDFEKGEASGSRVALQLISITVRAWLSANTQKT
jgi:uridine phosphorylase